MPKPLQLNTCSESVFKALFEKHSENLHDFLYYKFGEQFNPADKVQEAFVKLWENCKKVTPDKARSYLFTVANNLMLNEANHRKVVLKYTQLPQRTHTEESPHYVLEEKEYMDRLQAALAKLTEAQRVAFLLNRVEGKKHKEIAALLNISTKAVEKRIYGALKVLKKEIKEMR